MSTKTSSSSGSSFPFSFGDYYHVMILNIGSQGTTILMYLEDGKWSLPYFEYPKIHLDGGTIPIVCKDFKCWLGITADNVYFTGRVELLGCPHNDSRVTPGEKGRVQLLLVDVHGVEAGDIDLPRGAEWNHADAIPLAFPPDSDKAVDRIIRNKILSCMDQSSSFLKSLSDERYRPRWHERASQFLAELISNHGEEMMGHVVQQHMSSTSTMLRLQSSLGGLYLKSPAKGCNETEITALVAELFPQVSPSILGVSADLNCFVSREFVHEEPNDIMDAVMALGKIQQASLQHIERLADAGCPVRDIERAAVAANEWPDKFSKLNLDPEWFVSALPRIEELCKELKEFRIPSTLVHGDFSANNVGFADREGRRDLVIFDWEYAYIGHPFFDFHRVYKQVSKDVRDKYLSLWTDFEDIGRARSAYEIAKKLGWVMKVESVLEWAMASNAQDPPYLADIAIQFAVHCDRKLEARTDEGR